MPHVDDGTLHALLDGALRAEEPARAQAVEAHLGVCADCRARLEAAASLRDRSGRVLGLLEPQVAPDFEEVLTRAGRPGPRTRLARQARWTRGLAWAATLVLGLGTGYLIRDRLVPGPASEAMLDTVPADASRGAVTVEEQRAAEMEPARGEAGGRPEAGAPPAPRRAAADGGGAGAAGTGAAEPAQGESATPEATERLAAGQAGRPADRDGGADAAPAPAIPEPERARDPVRREVAAADAEQAERSDRPVVAAADAEQAARRDSPVVAAAPPAPPRPPAADSVPEPAFSGRLALEAIVVTGVATRPDEPRKVTPEDAASLLDAPLLLLPGAELGEVLARTGPEGVEVVSVQRLSDGVEVRVTQRPAAGVEAGIAPSAPAAATLSAPPPEREPVPVTGGNRVQRSRARPLGRPEGAPVKRLTPDLEDTAGARTVLITIGEMELELVGSLPEQALRALGAAAAPYRPPD